MALPSKDDAGGFDRRTLIRRGLVAGAALGVARVPAAFASGVARSAAGGGTLSVGLIGGTDVFDPNLPVSTLDHARNRQIFNLLSHYNAKGQVAAELAESITPNSTGDVWVAKLRSGVKWSDGSPLTPQDVIYSYKRILNPATASFGASTLTMLPADGMTQVGSDSIRFKLSEPYWFFPSATAAITNYIVKEGTTKFTASSLVGTGPFKLTQVVTGQREQFAKNPHYWQPGLPKVDTLNFVEISDTTARFDALLSGQVNAIEALSLPEADTAAKSSTIALLNSRSGAWSPFCMNVTDAPFDNPKVRQALRLILDRKQALSIGLGGYGTIANDLFGLTDPLYAGSDFPQRDQDLAQARSLLRAAGHKSLDVTLHTSDVATGVLDASQLFAQHASGAGVNVNLVTSPAATYYSDVYLKVPFYMSNWAQWPLDLQISLSFFTPKASNETQWSDPTFTTLVKQGRAEPSVTKRTAIYKQAQSILYDQGSYIIWGFANWLDGYNKNVVGLVTNPVRALGFYDFTNAYVK